ncbi:tail fiber protein H [Clostridium botulinum E1 str. 'BoNT E Beluga']|nr:tail fiber protein H [Clostridium botulinum E1 str. 'BoNT E Beluga']
MDIYTLVTNIGKAKIANATVTGSKVDFLKLKVGDGNGSYYEPSESQTDLVHTVWEGNVNNVLTGGENNPNWIIVQTVIPPGEGGFYVREAGIFDNDDNLLAISKYPESYKPSMEDGSTDDLTIELIFEVSNASIINLKIDPLVTTASMKDLNNLEAKINTQLKEIANKVDNIKIADGTTTTKGIVKLNNATNSTSQTEAATPLAVKTAMDKANEAFQYASNGKNLIAGKVGNVTGSNTHAEIANRIQTDKNTAAANLNAKNVSVSGNETLASLASKIANITVAGMGGKRFTSGNTKFDGTTDIRFQSVNKDFQPESGYSNTYYVTITLNFNPSYGVVYAKTSSSSGFNVSTLVNSNAVWTGNGLLAPIISGNTIKIPFSDKYVTSNVTYIFFE